MKTISCLFLICCTACAPMRSPLVSPVDLAFLEDLTRAVVDSSRILPGQDLPAAIRSFGPNRSGITLIKPGGRDCYPSFWIRDYAMSLESGFITNQEQLDILLYTAARQSDSTWTTKTGSLVPRGSIPDHIRINDGLPVYFPGTYDYVNQGNEIWRMPPYCDQFYFIHMAWFYIHSTEDPSVLNRRINNINLFNRMELAFDAVPAHSETELAYINDSLPTCDFGFRDIISMTGEVCFGSLLRYRSAMEIAELCDQNGTPQKSEMYRAIAKKIKGNLIKVFADDRGMLRASTGKSRQPDVWATAFAVYIGALEGKVATNACNVLAKAYQAGTLAMEGQIRHVLTTDDFDSTTAWEKSLAGKNTYQNGAYWGTPTGWVCQAIARVDKPAASKLAMEFIDHLRKTDFRLKGTEHGAPYECIYPPTGYKQNPVYMTTVTAPFAVFRHSFPTH
ncbi:MAG: hypothetical protein NTV01_17335 [Bacteroidia bacterium]|nr:hypothetical protein [Bacteroidia bacterium]